MTAGSIAVPTIIPLRVPKGPKHVIDSSTKIELASGELGGFNATGATLRPTKPL